MDGGRRVEQQHKKRFRRYDMCLCRNQQFLNNLIKYHLVIVVYIGLQKTVLYFQDELNCKKRQMLLNLRKNNITMKNMYSKHLPSYL